MKIKTKLLLAYIVWLFSGLLLLYLSIFIDSIFIIILIILFASEAVFVMLLKCPKCKKPVLNNPVNIFGTEVWLTTPWMPKYCSKCGNDLV